MVARRVSDLTVEELKVLIQESIREELRKLALPTDRRSLDEVLESVERNRWTPPPGSKSTLELLREDRDQ